MKQSVSVWMDGELFEDQAEKCLAKLKSHPEARETWAIYHLIGDVLRQPEHIPADSSTVISTKIQDEPVILAPQTRTTQQRAFHYALSAAATLAAVGVVAWMSLGIAPKSATVTASSAAIGSTHSESLQPDANEYLLAHQEFSPSTDINGGASYIRAVAYNSTR
jgi:sigma-E factor negative regulatory protein RseA